MNLSKNFLLEEFIHPDIFNHPAIGERAEDFLHPSLVVTAEALKRNLTGELSGDVVEIVTINNWVWNGVYQDSGLRLPTGSVGAPLSSHRFGNTMDPKYKHHTAAQVYDHILDNQELYPFISRMENILKTPTWNHIEVGDVRVGAIIVFNP